MDLPCKDGIAGIEEMQEAGPPFSGKSESAEWGLVSDYYEHHYESESTRFSAAGVNRTAAGLKIDFTVDL